MISRDEAIPLSPPLEKEEREGFVECLRCGSRDSGITRVMDGGELWECLFCYFVWFRVSVIPRKPPLEKGERGGFVGAGPPEADACPKNVGAGLRACPDKECA